MTITNRLTALALAALALGALAAFALADATSVRDRKQDTAALKRKPELDIVHATAGHAVGDSVKHKITMLGKLTPQKKNTRPFLLINTRGDSSSDFEYLVLGPRVFKSINGGKRFKKTGANQFSARKRTWVYRFKPESIGSPKSYGWAALTAKGKTVDLAPNKEYQLHRL